MRNLPQLLFSGFIISLFLIQNVHSQLVEKEATVNFIPYNDISAAGVGPEQLRQRPIELTDTITASYSLPDNLSRLYYLLNKNIKSNSVTPTLIEKFNIFTRTQYNHDYSWILQKYIKETEQYTNSWSGFCHQQAAARASHSLNQFLNQYSDGVFCRLNGKKTFFFSGEELQILATAFYTDYKVAEVLGNRNFDETESRIHQTIATTLGINELDPKEFTQKAFELIKKNKAFAMDYIPTGEVYNAAFFKILHQERAENLKNLNPHEINAIPTYHLVLTNPEDKSAKEIFDLYSETRAHLENHYFLSGSRSEENTNNLYQKILSESYSLFNFSEKRKMLRKIDPADSIHKVFDLFRFLLTQKILNLIAKDQIKLKDDTELYSSSIFLWKNLNKENSDYYYQHYRFITLKDSRDGSDIESRWTSNAPDFLWVPVETNTQKPFNSALQDLKRLTKSCYSARTIFSDWNVVLQSWQKVEEKEIFTAKLNQFKKKWSNFIDSPATDAFFRIEK